MTMTSTQERLITPALMVSGMVLLGSLFGCAPVKAQEGAAEAAKTELRARIKEAGKFAEEKYSFSSWNDLRFAMNAARRTADKAEATPDELGAASTDVQAKIAALQERPVVPDQNPRIGLSESV